MTEHINSIRSCGDNDLNDRVLASMDSSARSCETEIFIVSFIIGTLAWLSRVGARAAPVTGAAKHFGAGGTWGEALEAEVVDPVVAQLGRVGRQLASVAAPSIDSSVERIP